MPLLGSYMAQVFSGKMSYLRGVEVACYRLIGTNEEEMTWVEYAKALFFLNLLGFIWLFLLQLLQGHLPLNPQQLPGLSWDLAFNTAMSFCTNTNWQSYSGETTMSYLTQMTGLAVQNFLSAATGLASSLVLIRGFVQKSLQTIGNFWVDFVRAILYLLLPLSILLAIVLVGQGVIQTFDPYVEAITLEQEKQTIPLGPVASQVAIKQVGTNGGGFFNANSAHPFENPSRSTNFFETLAILLIPASSMYMYGALIGVRKHGWILFFVALFFCFSGLGISLYSQYLHNPIFDTAPLVEGQETRFGIAKSILWSVTTTDTSNGSVNAMLSSLEPLAGGVSLFNMMLGELIFGGVGVGLASMIMFVLLTIFLCGLMVGRTPEYLGKKIEKQEIRWVMVAVLVPGILILIGSGISSVLPNALSSLANNGPHGLSEILYAFTSAAGNNGSAFAGLNANTVYYNVILGCVMCAARIAIILPSIALGGLLSSKRLTAPSIGTFSVNTWLFACLLIGVVIIVGALTFFPALALGPIVENFLMLQGRTF